MQTWIRIRPVLPFSPQNHKCWGHGGGVVYGRMPRCATQGCCLFALMHHHHLPPPALKQLPHPTQPSHFVPLPEQIPNVHHSCSLSFKRRKEGVVAQSQAVASFSRLWDRRWRARVLPLVEGGISSQYRDTIAQN